MTRYEPTSSNDVDGINPLAYYDLESYLFDDVGHWFTALGKLSAFGLFSIVIWKANRAKSRVAKRLLETAPGESLDAISQRIADALTQAEDDREAMRILVVDWGFRLPMASAILTVLYPDRFTVFDIRACDSLRCDPMLCKAANSSVFDKCWEAYRKFRDEVLRFGRQQLSMRDADRVLWSTSVIRQLQQNIASEFTT